MTDQVQLHFLATRAANPGLQVDLIGQNEHAAERHEPLERSGR
jgi:hypothetical protein